MQNWRKNIIITLGSMWTAHQSSELPACLIWKGGSQNLLQDQRPPLRREQRKWSLKSCHLVFHQHILSPRQLFLYSVSAEKKKKSIRLNIQWEGRPMVIFGVPQSWCTLILPAVVYRVVYPKDPRSGNGETSIIVPGTGEGFRRT